MIIKITEENQFCYYNMVRLEILLHIIDLKLFTFSGKTLKAEVAKPAPDPLVRKRKQEEGGDVQDKKKKEDDRDQDTRLKDAITPYWHIPYEEQVSVIFYYLRR